MLGRHVYRVHPGDGRWQIIKEGESAPRGAFGGREAAVAEACRLAEADTPSRVTMQPTPYATGTPNNAGAEPILDTWCPPYNRIVHILIIIDAAKAIASPRVGMTGWMNEAPGGTSNKPRTSQDPAIGATTTSFSMR